MRRGISLDFPHDSVRGAAHIAGMPKSEKVMTFDDFRVSHDDALRRQREHLRDDAVAKEVLREGGSGHGWIPWEENALAFES